MVLSAVSACYTIPPCGSRNLSILWRHDTVAFALKLHISNASCKVCAGLCVDNSFPLFSTGL